MVRILHISDPHAQTATMKRLERLAFDQHDCDVVALTGDCTSKTCKQVPATWNSWPQQLKLAVPGNHDDDKTFDALDSWTATKPPWVVRHQDLLILGLGSLKASPLGDCIAICDCRDWQGINGLVVLCHYKPDFARNRDLLSLLQSLPGSGAVVWLHGDEHPGSFSTEWDESGFLGERKFFRSNVYSAADRRRGIAHRIEWKEGQFRCEPVGGIR